MTILATDPQLSDKFPDFPEIWKDPITGFKVPKVPHKNLAWRSEILHRADSDTGLRSDLIAACTASTLFYINAFGWTYRQEEVDENTHRTVPVTNAHVPFITWPVQDEAILAVERAIKEGGAIGLDKSRDMGATWICLYICDKYWIFRPESQILILSRTEDYVDKPGNHKALFWKLDYIHSWLPEWMCPPDIHPGQTNRTRMHLKNAWNGSVIDGESTTENAARGDRRFLVFMDEFAAVTSNAQAMRSATKDVTPCRIINSTPKAGSEYSKWVLSGKLKTVKLPWWEHPEKGLGRYVVQDEVTQKFSISSPWYDIEKEERSPLELAQELDMDHLGSGNLFFESNVLEQHKALFCFPPKARRKIEFKKDVPEAMISRIIKGRSMDWIRVMPTSGKFELDIYVQLIEGRPDQSKTYTMGIDISKGQGASNSVISIRCDQTGEKVAEFANANTMPHDLARKVMAIAIWVGGANPRRLPFIIWEANGPGWDFGKIVTTEYQYPFYYRDRQSGTVEGKKSKKYGFHSSRQKKEELLSLYRRKLAVGGFINHSLRAIEEAGTYVYYDDGEIGPTDLVEESKSARLTHGDRTIADALTVWTGRDIGKIKHEDAAPPGNSVGFRRKQVLGRKEREKKSRGKWRKQFSFVKG